MKKTISALLAVVLVTAILAGSASAAGSFNKSVFQNSTKFTQRGSSWSLIGGYEKHYSNAQIAVYALLFDDYISGGYGPELRVIYYNPTYDSFDEVVAFRVEVDGVVYSFDNMFYDESSGTSSIFGCSVYQKFMNDILDLSEASFQIDHITPAGECYTSTENHIHTGELSDLMDMAKYLITSKAFSVVEDPERMDDLFEASIH